MLPRLDATTVTPPAAADAAGAASALGDGRQAAFQRALQSLVGQQVPAEVLSKYSDGSFLVKVADNAVRMALPAYVQVGAELPLTVISAQPRPTFQLGTGPVPGSPSVLLYTETPPAAGTLPEGLYGPPLPGQDAQAAGRPQAGAPAQPGQAAGAGNTAQTPPGAATGLAGVAAASAGTAAALPAATAPAGAAGVPGLPSELPGDTRATSAGSGAAWTPGAATGTAAGAAAGAASLPAASAAGLAAGSAASATVPYAAAGAANAAATGDTANGAALAAGLQAAGVDLTRPQRLAATLLGKAPLTPAADLPKLDPSTPAPTLSSTARVLTSLLSAAQGSAATLIGKSALFSDGPPATAQLAQRLSDTIAQSGLFYESHVAEWVRGERTLPELLQEPQMQRLAQTAETAARAAGPDLSAAQMVNQQLNSHEQGRVQWNGQAWPGQHMQWEIRREQRDGEAGQGGADGPPEPVWRSGVRFRFAMLGEVSATVTLVGDQVHLQMQTDTHDAATTLRAYAGQLEQAMEAAGAPLSSLTISGSEAGDE